MNFVNIMKKLKLSLLKILATFAVTACALGINNADDLKNSIRMQSGSEGCRGCNNIKIFTSSGFGGGAYRLSSGGYISASAALGATNGDGGFYGSLNLTPERVAYAKSLKGEGHLFNGTSNPDGKHPYRFFISIHHNSNAGDQPVYLVLSENNYASMPSFRFGNRANQKSCVSNGCVWDEDYAISAEIVDEAIQKNMPLTIFVGNRLNTQVESKDGYNKSFKTVNAGVYIVIPSAYLKVFLDEVSRKI